MFCGNCGTENVNGAKFCKNCGQELVGSNSSNTTDAGAKESNKMGKETEVSVDINQIIEKIKAVPMKILVSGCVAIIALIVIICIAVNNSF